MTFVKYTCDHCKQEIEYIGRADLLIKDNSSTTRNKSFQADLCPKCYDELLRFFGKKE